MRNKVTGECKTLHNEERYNLHSSLNIIWVMKSRRMRWVGHVACLREMRGACRFLVGNWRERGHLEDLSIDWRMK